MVIFATRSVYYKQVRNGMFAERHDLSPWLNVLAGASRVAKITH